MPELLSSAQRQDALENLTGWSEATDGKAIRKVFEFRDFKQAFGFMSQAALKAEQMDPVSYTHLTLPTIRMV